MATYRCSESQEHQQMLNCHYIIARVYIMTPKKLSNRPKLFNISVCMTTTSLYTIRIPHSLSSLSTVRHLQCRNSWICMGSEWVHATETGAGLGMRPEHGKGL